MSYEVNDIATRAQDIFLLISAANIEDLRPALAQLPRQDIDAILDYEIPELQMSSRALANMQGIAITHLVDEALQLASEMNMGGNAAGDQIQELIQVAFVDINRIKYIEQNYRAVDELLRDVGVLTKISLAIGSQGVDLLLREVGRVSALHNKSNIEPFDSVDVAEEFALSIIPADVIPDNLTVFQKVERILEGNDAYFFKVDNLRIILQTLAFVAQEKIYKEYEIKIGRNTPPNPRNFKDPLNILRNAIEETVETPIKEITANCTNPLTNMEHTLQKLHKEVYEAVKKRLDDMRYTEVLVKSTVMIAERDNCLEKDEIKICSHFIYTKLSDESPNYYPGLATALKLCNVDIKNLQESVRAIVQEKFNGDIQSFLEDVTSRMPSTCDGERPNDLLQEHNKQCGIYRSFKRPNEAASKKPYSIDLSADVLFCAATLSVDEYSESEPAVRFKDIIPAPGLKSCIKRKAEDDDGALVKRSKSAHFKEEIDERVYERDASGSGTEVEEDALPTVAPFAADHLSQALTERAVVEGVQGDFDQQGISVLGSDGDSDFGIDFVSDWNPN